MLAAQPDPTFGNMLMLVAVLLLLTLLVYNIRKRGRGQEDRPDPRQQMEQRKQAGGMQNDLREMMVELENVTRQFSSQLDAKSRKLEKLIEQADERIATLQRMAPGGERSVGDDGQLQGPTRVESMAPGPASDPGPASSAAPAEVETPAAAEPTPVSKKVYQLADAGCDAAQIARELGEHIGKVELILALRQEESA